VTEATTDYLVLPIVMPSTSPAPSHWTVEMQMKPQPDQGLATHFFSAPWVLMCNQATQQSLAIFISPTTTTTRPANFCEGGVGKDLMIVWDSTATNKLSVYVNGLLAATPPITPTNQIATGRIGMDVGTATGYSGELSEISIYSTSLAATDAWAHYYAFRCGGQIIAGCSI